MGLAPRSEQQQKYIQVFVAAIVLWLFLTWKRKVGLLPAEISLYRIVVAGALGIVIVKLLSFVAFKLF